MVIDKVVFGIWNKMKYRIKYAAFLMGWKNKDKFMSYKGRKKIFFMMIPSYGNIGDQAIVQSTLYFLNDFFSEYQLIQIDFDKTFDCLYGIKRVCDESDIIVLQGGGNIGTLYLEAEMIRRCIVKWFPNNQIISMPQSVYFEESEFGKRQLKITSKIYNSHKHLTLIGREKYSYNFMKDHFPNCHVILNPDMVFYLSKYYKENDHTRDRIVFCFRSDKESVLNQKKEECMAYTAENMKNVFIYDTEVARRIYPQMRKLEIESLLAEFSRAKVVITDRLHGMVLAALSNTPCIVFPSLDKKILGTYEWIKDHPHLQFCQDTQMSKIHQIINKMNENTVDVYHWDNLVEQYFNSLKTKIMYE